MQMLSCLYCTIYNNSTKLNFCMLHNFCDERPYRASRHYVIGLNAWMNELLPFQLKQAFLAVIQTRERRQGDLAG